MNYNLREQSNIYAGTALGILTPIVAVKYSLNLLGVSNELVAWTGSFFINALPFALPLSVFGKLGEKLGNNCANNLRNSRINLIRATDELERLTAPETSLI